VVPIFSIGTGSSLPGHMETLYKSRLQGLASSRTRVQRGNLDEDHKEALVVDDSVVCSHCKPYHVSRGMG
tara:strand:- start:2782 stop:2991 length:210 start_codon:yes stop_codon:yes gene_type:complete